MEKVIIKILDSEHNYIYQSVIDYSILPSIIDKYKEQTRYINIMIP